MKLVMVVVAKQEERIAIIETIVDHQQTIAPFVLSQEMSLKV